MSKINIVLLEPEIPQNTGNIARTCAATGSALHLIEPMGFTVTDAQIKSSALACWNKLDITCYKTLEDFSEKTAGGSYFYFSTKAPRCYTDIEYPDECYLIFGKESRGIPEEILKKNLDKCVRIPMLENLRSLNLSNSAAIAVYEVLRQRRFADLEKQGFLKMLYTN